jgi:hypothetical protein
MEYELKGRLEGVKDILEMLGIDVKVVGFNDCICHVTYPISNLSIKEEVERQKTRICQELTKEEKENGQENT